MPRHRFELLKKTAPFAFADVATKHKDVWYMVTPVVKEFNENRRRTIHTGRVLTMDELMSPFRPRTTKHGSLPSISFIMRKPKPAMGNTETTMNTTETAMSNARRAHGQRKADHGQTGGDHGQNITAKGNE